MANKKNKKVKASITVEAAFIIPMTLFLIVGGINIGYDMFQQARDASKIQEEIQKLDPVKIVRKCTFIQGIMDEYG